MGFIGIAKREDVKSLWSGGTSGPAAWAIDAIIARKSVSPKRLEAPGPGQPELDMMFTAALTAPDHGNLRAWRAVLIPDARRADLAEIFATAKLEECPLATEYDLTKAREKAFNGPVIVAILMRELRDHSQVTLEEQYIALGAALQNVLLVAHLLGYGAMITSGKKMRSRALQAAFSSSNDELAVAFITVGTASCRMPTPKTDEDRRHLSHWPGLSGYAISTKVADETAEG